MSDEQKSQGMPLPDEYNVGETEAQPKAKPAANTVAQTPSDGGEEIPKEYTENTTTKTAGGGKVNNPDPTKDAHPYWHAVTNLVTHPLQSVDQAHEYYANQSKVPTKELADEDVNGGNKPLNSAQYVAKQLLTPTKTTAKRGAAALGDIALMPIDMARQGYHAIVDAPKNDVEAAVEASGNNTMYPGSGRAALAAKRLLYDPQEAEYNKGQEALAQGHKAEFFGHSLAADVPLIGPMVAQLGEEAGQGDIAGAAAKGAALIAVPKIAKEAMPGSAAANRFAGRDTAGESSIPTIKEAPKKIAGPIVRGVSGAATKVQSALPYATGVAAGELVGHPWLGAAVGRALFPKEAVARILETGRMWGLSDEDAAAKWTAEQAADLNKKAQSAKSDLDKFKASTRQGNAPQKYVDAYTKAQRLADEANYHAEEAARAAKEAKAQPKKPTPTVAEVPTEEVTAAPVLSKLGEKKPPLQQINVPPTVSPAHAATTIPQEPVEAPRMPTGRVELANNQGTVGTPRLLTEGTPEVAKAPIPEEKPTVAPKDTKPERGNLRDLKVDETGKVVEKDAEGERLHQLLIESLKNTKGNENFPAATVEKEAPTEKPAVKTAEEPAENAQGIDAKRMSHYLRSRRTPCR